MGETRKGRRRGRCKWCLNREESTSYENNSVNLLNLREIEMLQLVKMHVKLLTWFTRTRGEIETL